MHINPILTRNTRVPRLARSTKCVFVAAVVVTFFPSAAYASGDGMGCNPNRSPANFAMNSSGIAENLYFAGLSADCEPSCGGIQGYIYTYSPYVYPATSNGYVDASAQWVMLANIDTGHFAQAGWAEQQNNVRNAFVEYYDPTYGYNWTNFFSYPGFKELEEYKVLYDPSCTDNQCWTWWDAPAGSSSWTYLTSSRDNQVVPNFALSQVETRTISSQFPGGTADNANASALQLYQPAGSGSWAYMQGYGDAEWMSNYDTQSNALPSYDNLNYTPATDNYEAWDSACTN